MLEPTLDNVATAGSLVDLGTLHLDGGYDSCAVRKRLAGYQLDELEIQRRGTEVPNVKKRSVPLGPRWIVEATNPAGSPTTGNSGAAPTPSPATATATHRSAWPLSSLSSGDSWHGGTGWSSEST